MPNWCENRLEICGPDNEIARFREVARDDERLLSFQKLHPMPAGLEGTGSPGDTPNWYDWRVEHWGTKWDLGKDTYEDGDVPAIYGFATAWAPPIALVAKVSKDFPTLVFRVEYAEPGMGFAGYVEFQDGERVDGGQGDLADFEWSKKLIWELCEKCDEEYQVYGDEKHVCAEKEE